jgi:hypothetical protein
MRRECFVDGGPHENRSVIFGVPGTSHDFDVWIYTVIVQCTRNPESDRSFPCGPPHHPELLDSF